MPKRAKKARPRESPGGPGGMAALRRAQEKLKAMGIKPWKAPEPPRPKKAAPPAPAPAPAPRAKRAAPAAPVARTSAARGRASAKKAPAKSRRRA
ncbi:MAG TPA: hypothetical protein VFH78_06080 [Candidatus Thermoplasmatota archaeon]|nr:hypothetical protein [Candidatus Thermoplasmatota archaeon]